MNLICQVCILKRSCFLASNKMFFIKMIKKGNGGKRKLFDLTSSERKALVKKATLEANGVQMKTLRKAGYKTV